LQYKNYEQFVDQTLSVHWKKIVQATDFGQRKINQKVYLESIHIENLLQMCPFEFLA
jgi:hypothetical protein